MKRVIIIGGGFGGLNAALALCKADLQILLIDRTNHHLFQPLLYQVATAALSPGNIAAPLRHVLAKQKNASVLMADIAQIDKEKRQVIAVNGNSYSYDYLILAPGARHSYFGHAEWEELAPGLKTLNDAIRIRERVLLSYERAERCATIEEAEKFLHFVVIGAGPTGVEMAGAIAEIATKTLVRDFRHVDSTQTRIYLLDAADQLLPSYPKPLADKAKADLEKMGVEVHLKAFVDKITPNGVYFGEHFIESPNVIWAAGNAASPLLKTLEVPLDKAGRVIVNPDLTIADHPELFVIGDAALAYDKRQRPLPGIAPVAIQQSRYVAQLIAKGVAADKRKPFKYFDKGMMATVGKAKAVAAVGGLQMSGFTAWLAWCFIHIAYLISFSNRVQVMIQWFYLYICNQRRIRLITRPISDFEDPLNPDHN
jgi:NADH dehydrogenase